MTDKLRVIDSHTEGEPTRVVVEGGPNLGGGTVARQRDVLCSEFDWIRRSLIWEPRGSDVMVGAILCPPAHPEAVAGVIFFNNSGYLNMCGHGMIGVMTTLAYLGKITPGVHRVETPVGTVSATLHEDGSVSFQNVPAYRSQTSVAVDVPGYGTITGDIAWGGNWFFLVKDHPLPVHPDHIPQLMDFLCTLKLTLQSYGMTGAEDQEIDHLEMFGPPLDERGDSVNFVLCPGNAFDRSPCGTGTSAKLACLAADGKLQPGEVWRQQAITGGVFQGSYRPDGDKVIPTITGRAFVNAEVILIFHPEDPFRHGIASLQKG